MDSAVYFPFVKEGGPHYRRTFKFNVRNPNRNLVKKLCLIPGMGMVLKSRLAPVENTSKSPNLHAKAPVQTWSKTNEVLATFT